MTKKELETLLDCLIEINYALSWPENVSYCVSHDDWVNALKRIKKAYSELLKLVPKD